MLKVYFSHLILLYLSLVSSLLLFVFLYFSLLLWEIPTALEDRILFFNGLLTCHVWRWVGHLSIYYTCQELSMILFVMFSGTSHLFPHSYLESHFHFTHTGMKVSGIKTWTGFQRVIFLEHLGIFLLALLSKLWGPGSGGIWYKWNPTISTAFSLLSLPASFHNTLRIRCAQGGDPIFSMPPPFSYLPPLWHFHRPFSPGISYIMYPPNQRAALSLCFLALSTVSTHLYSK